MEQTIDVAQWKERIVHTADLQALEGVRLDLLGKKGVLTCHMKELGTLSGNHRQARGQYLNQIKQDILQALQIQKENLVEKEWAQTLAKESLDTTLPITPQPCGHIHPLTQAIAEIIFIFGQMGFSTVEGPDIEDDFHNFTALNVPAHHPARSPQDTFYLPPLETVRLLRTHTSPVQIRALKKTPPPLRILVPGRVFRADWDQTHTPMFHQIEGLVIEPDLHMGHLKGCLSQFCTLFFQTPNLPLRFRPSFFPFTEPSAEVDIGSFHRDGQLHIGQADHQNWMEILGCGMVHPAVLRNCGLDPDIYQGFAFGLGIERMAMLKYGITDLRNFFENDQRWLNHYGFRAEECPL